MVLRFPHILISQIFYLHHSHFRPWLISPLPLEVVLIINRDIVNYGALRGDIVNYGILCGHPDHNIPWYWKVCRFEGCAAVLKWALLNFYLLVLLWNETSLWIYEYKYDNTNRKQRQSKTSLSLLTRA